MESILAFTITFPDWATIWSWVQPILTFAFVLFTGGSLLRVNINLRGNVQALETIKTNLNTAFQVLETMDANMNTNAQALETMDANMQSIHADVASNLETLQVDLASVSANTRDMPARVGETVAKAVSSVVE